MHNTIIGWAYSIFPCPIIDRYAGLLSFDQFAIPLAMMIRRLLRSNFCLEDLSVAPVRSRSSLLGLLIKKDLFPHTCISISTLLLLLPESPYLTEIQLLRISDTFMRQATGSGRQNGKRVQAGGEDC
jgi:hypothetical protein